MGCLTTSVSCENSSTYLKNTKGHRTMNNEKKTPIGEVIIRNNPTGYGLFAGIGDNFNSMGQVICELADDAISNLRANCSDPDLSMTVVLSFENLGDAVRIGVVDGGTGISDLNSALTIACRDGAQTPLNEHGFGLKHALASCDSGPTQKWDIRTCTKKDAQKNRYREVTAPYSMGTSENDKPMKARFYSGTGGLPHRTGTAISVRCPMVKFRTVKPDRKAASSDFHSLVRYVIEELRYVYAGVLADTGITMEVVEISDGVEKHHVLTPLLPAWEDGTVTDYGDVPCDLGGGPLTIRCKYGNILPTKANAVYYKCNMSSSGVELRINGRAIEHGLFDRVWGEAVHPSQNRFLVQVDLITDNSAALPATKNTKTSFCEADPRLKNLLSWIASYVPAPAKDVDTLEARYIRELTAKRESDPNALRVSREEPVFQKIGLKAKVDLFVGFVNGVTIYEAKSGRTKALDLYQLRMYVDGCALDNKPVDEAVLIAKSHPAEVRELREILNGLAAPDGRPYNFRLATWDEEGIVIQQSA